MFGGRKLGCGVKWMPQARNGFRALQLSDQFFHLTESTTACQPYKASQRCSLVVKPKQCIRLQRILVSEGPRRQESEHPAGDNDVILTATKFEDEQRVICGRSFELDLSLPSRRHLESTHSMLHCLSSGH